MPSHVANYVGNHSNIFYTALVTSAGHISLARQTFHGLLGAGNNKLAENMGWHVRLANTHACAPLHIPAGYRGEG